MSSIPIALFGRCVLCGALRREITNSYPGRANGAYYLHKFCRHLVSVHELDLRAYCELHLHIEWPRCPVSGVPVGFRLCGHGVRLAKYKKGVGITKSMSPAFAESCERASVARKGSGNPMWQKEPWNKGLPLDGPYCQYMAGLKRGVVYGPQTRLKHRRNRATHPRKARHVTPHTEETKAKIRLRTAAMHERRAFGGGSSIERMVGEMLDSLGAKFISQYRIAFYTVDIAFPDKRLALELDGDFFHVNPAYYPDGPQCAIQQRNAINDAAKDSYLKNRGWQVVRYWESAIRSPEFVQRLKADLVKLSVLKE